MILFLKKKDRFLSLVLKHIGTSALMDLLLRLVSCVEPVGLRQEVLHVSVRPVLSEGLCLSACACRLPGRLVSGSGRPELGEGAQRPPECPSLPTFPPV